MRIAPEIVLTAGEEKVLTKLSLEHIERPVGAPRQDRIVGLAWQG